MDYDTASDDRLSSLASLSFSFSVKRSLQRVNNREMIYGSERGAAGNRAAFLIARVMSTAATTYY
jgi:hypothetical protein